MSLPWPRYKVTTVTGYPIGKIGAQQKYRDPGLSAHVLDRWHSHNVVATFRSEDPIPGFYRGRGRKGGNYGVEGAKAAAEAECERRNALARRRHNERDYRHAQANVLPEDGKRRV